MDVNPLPVAAAIANPQENQDNRLALQNQPQDLAIARPPDTRWEASFRLDIPEFHGGIRGDLLLDWIVSVEEILEFKRVPEDRRVPLVATKFRGHAASWWQQTKSTRSRNGKNAIQSWDKLKKKTQRHVYASQL